ncbi:hypothetical protein llap_21014 [Limosa lapponica baueri]|uniref:Uncharacterized protein n=1 Tax=Limosa lapponica baueri TaxID=1758121 RepID=A0A2I0T4G1_LIMLA|nr:hypothetical protein llap_21014 [Limosa lapponica baueri]
MTGEKILDPSCPFIASDLVPKLGQLYGMTSSSCVNDWKLNDFKHGENMALFPLKDSTKVHQELSIVQSDEKLVISASWAKDDDISRLLKSLPNWSNMAQPKQLRPKREEEEDFIRCQKAG